jgi:hypothetical protein
MTPLRQLHIHEFDPELKAKLIDAANAQEVSLNDYAVGVLAAHFKVKFRGTGRKSPGAKVSNGAIMLPVPEALFNRIGTAVSKMPKGQRSKRAVVESIMRDHFDAA